jgi:hypothetical protein
MAQEKIVQTAGRTQLGEFAPKFAELNDNVLFLRQMLYLILFSSCFQFYYSILFINFAGTPPTIVFASTSFVTTAPAPTTALSPIVTP